MKLLLKLISAFAASLIIISLIYCIVLGADGVSSILGWNVNDCQYGQFSFSLSDHFKYILIASLIIVGLFTLVFIKTDHFILHVRGGVNCIKENIVATWNAIWYSKLKYILPIPLLTYIYFAVTLPITHDEATTYVYYISCSIMDTISLYTMPNNHILFSLLAKPFTAINVLDLLLAVRLPAILVSMLIWPTLYRFVRKFYSENTALAVVAVSSMSLMVIVYSIFSRGYCLIMLTTVVCLYAAYNIINGGNRVRHWAIFTISSIIGFYAVPTFLYSCLVINFFILIYNYRQIGKQIYYNVIAAAITYLLYMPVFIVMGLEAITDNGFVKPLPLSTLLERLYPFAIRTITDLYGIVYYVIIPLIVAIIIYSTTLKVKRTCVLWILFMATPFIMIIAQSVIPFTRTFSYLGIIIVLLIGFTFNEQLIKIGRKTLLITLIFVQLGGLAYFAYYSPFTVMMYASFEDLVNDYLEDKKSYVYKCDFLDPNIKFEVERLGLQNVKLQNLDADSINTDSIKEFDYIIIERQVDKTCIKQPTDTVPYGYQHRMLNIYYSKD